MNYEHLIKPAKKAVSEDEFLSRLKDVKRCFVGISKDRYFLCLLANGEEIFLETGSRELFKRCYRQVRKAGISINRVSSHLHMSYALLAISGLALILVYLFQSAL